MALRLKILGVISIALVSLFAILYVTSQVILGSSFAALEDQDTRQNLERARDALLAELLALHTKSADWANWDDTYAFIEDANPDYIESNLVDKAFVDLRLNLMLFIAPSGELIFTKAFDLQNEKEIALPPSLAPHLSSDSPLLKQPDPNRGLTGIVLLAEGPLLISSRPILTSEGKGPSRGTLIFGRYLDDASLQRLAETTHLSLAARTFDDAQMPPDFQSAKAVLSETTPRFVQPSSQSSIMGYGLLQDVYSKPALLLRVELPRDIYQQGQATIRYLMLWVIAIGLVFGAVAQFTMDRLVSAWQERARLFAEEQTRREELGALYTLSRAVAETVDFDVILNLVTRRAVETIRCTFARVHLIEDTALVLRAAYPVRVLNRDLQIGRRDRIGEFPYCQRILQQDAPVLLRADSPEIDDYEHAMLFLYLARTLCLVPLRAGDPSAGSGRVFGLLLLGEERSEAREPFTPEKTRLARSIGEQTASALHRAELFVELERAYLQTVLALARAVDAKDTYTGDHSERLADMALAVGRTLGMSARELEDLRYGAMLHDIGKIGIADAILQNPSELGADERGRMRQHSAIGAQILAPVPRLAGAARIVRHHHERYDGTGYPDQLAGEAIPLGARILTVVDSYSAIMDRRVYKDARSREEAIAELTLCRHAVRSAHCGSFLRLVSRT